MIFGHNRALNIGNSQHIVITNIFTIFIKYALLWHFGILLAN